MIEDFIFAILMQSPELAPYRGGGVYPIVSPKKGKGWYLTYQQISEAEPTQAESPVGTTWQINIVGQAGFNSPNYRSGKTAAKIVKSIMTEFRGEMSGICVDKIRFENQIDLSDENTNTFFVAQNYLIEYFEALEDG